MSKTFSMPGWRMGFAVGNERLIAALTRVKSYLDYGAFTPIQVAAAAALNGDGSDIAEVRDVYHKRRDVMVETFGRAGWDIPAPAASMFAWAPIPEQFRHLGSLEFSKLLIEKADVAVAPGIGFGEHGDDYVRIALVENEHRIRQAARNIKRFLVGSATSSRTMWCRWRRGAERHPRTLIRTVEGTSLDMAEALRIGIAGLGTVGASVVRVLRDKAPNSPASAAATSS